MLIYYKKYYYFVKKIIVDKFKRGVPVGSSRWRRRGSREDVT